MWSSYIHGETLQKEFYPQWNFEKEWLFAQSKNNFRPEEYFGFHRWKECTKMFIDLQEIAPDRVKIIKYEELVHSPFEKTKEMFRFIGIIAIKNANAIQL